MFAGDWSYNEEQHYHLCENEGCLKQDQCGNHTWKNPDAPVGERECSVCEYGAEQHAHEPYIVLRVEPTCTKDGNIEYFKCIGCDKLFSDSKGLLEITDPSKVILAKKGHTAKADDSDCTTPTRCKDCDDILTPAPSSAHNPGEEWHYDGEGHWKMCQNAGCTKRVGMVVHVLTPVAAKPACLSDGNIAYSTCECGCWLEGLTGYGSVIVDHASVVIKAKGQHTPASVREDCTVAVYCSVCNEIAIPSSGGHNKGNAWQKDATHHWHACANAGCKWTGDKAEHQWNYQAATEEHDKHCIDCEYVAEARLTHTHALTQVPAKAVKCLVDGNIEYYACACGKWFYDAAGVNEIANHADAVIAAPGHTPLGDDGDCTTDVRCSVCNEVATEGKANHDWSLWDYDPQFHWHLCGNAGCTKTGTAASHNWNAEAATEEHDKHCTICEYVAEARLLHTHALTLVPAKAAECLEDGNIAYYTCVCGQWFYDAGGQNVIKNHSSVRVASTGHYPEADDDDCTTNVLCSVCGEVAEAGYGIHDWSAWEYNSQSHWCYCRNVGCAQTDAFNSHSWNAAAATELHDKHCNVCFYVAERKLAHKHSLKFVEAKEVKCLEDGNIAHYECACGKWFYDAEGLKALPRQAVAIIRAPGHKPEKDDGDCTTAVLCSVCGDVVRNANESHNYNVVYSYDKECHWHKCRNFGCVAAADKREHRWNIEEATTEEAKKCQVCNYVIENAHTLTPREENEPTCEQPGSLAHYACDDCGKWFWDESALDVIPVASGVAIPPLGHKPEKDDGDCTTPIYCSVCGRMVAPGNDDHAWWGYALADSDKHYYACGICSKLRGEEHAWNVEEATDEVKKYCTLCLYEESDHEHSLKHVPGTDATCLNSGTLRYYTCECGKSFTDNGGLTVILDPQWLYIAPKGHSPNADDCDCTTPLLCLVCDAVVTPAQTAHYYGSEWMYTDHMHWQKCINGTCYKTTAMEPHEWENYARTQQACTVCANERIGCYVATSVYGSYDCPQVWTLRRFRDDTLAQTWYGRAFIDAYYAVSPGLVDRYGDNALFQSLGRGALDAFVSKLQEDGVESTPYEDKNWR